MLRHHPGRHQSPDVDRCSEHVRAPSCSRVVERNRGISPPHPDLYLVALDLAVEAWTVKGQTGVPLSRKRASVSPGSAMSGMDKPNGSVRRRPIDRRRHVLRIGPVTVIGEIQPGIRNRCRGDCVRTRVPLRSRRTGEGFVLVAPSSDWPSVSASIPCRDAAVGRPRDELRPMRGLSGIRDRRHLEMPSFYPSASTTTWLNLRLRPQWPAGASPQACLITKAGNLVYGHRRVTFRRSPR